MKCQTRCYQYMLSSPDISCPDTIENGVLSETCDTSYLEVCTYTCNIGYRPNNLLPNVTCVRLGEWSKEGLFNATLCIGKYNPKLSYLIIPL